MRPAPGIRESTLLLAILLAAAALRFSGRDWDSGTHMHPDERFLTMVATKLRFPESFRGCLRVYFDTAHSRLNPHNNGDKFFVYGTLPVFIVRMLGAWAGKTDYDQIHLVGRAASASFDLASVWLVYLIGRRLYDRRVGLLAAAFSAFSVLPIQHAHFFVVDPFANTFILGGLYFAVRALDDDHWKHYALFGLLLGMACASKLSAAPLAGVIALSSAARVRDSAEARSPRRALAFVWRLALAAAVSLIAFRVFQPYAFKSYSLALNPAWKDNLAALAQLARGATDFPPGMQWANRTPVWFSLKNLVLYGLGLPLGVLAWAAWGWALARVVRGDWRRHLIPVVWTGTYFLIGSVGFVTTMRYQLPVYPTLAVLAAWGLWQAWDRVQARWLVAAVGGVVLVATASHAVAFALNYSRPFTRYEASAWIYRHVPGPVNVVLAAGGDEALEPIALANGYRLHKEAGVELSFRAREAATAVSVLLPRATVDSDAGAGSLHVTLLGDDGLLAKGTAAVAAGVDRRLEVRLDRPVTVRKDGVYHVWLELLDAESLDLQGSEIVSESAWDDALPLAIEGRSASSGLYTSANQELYGPDTVDSDGSGRSDKLERLVGTLTSGDYIVITSNRQYGSVGRLPQKYPLTVAYYRALFGCPAPAEVEECAAEAAPGRTRGRLGFDLVAVFERNPTLGPLVFRDQRAEEAFTVYDHPKVLVFAKSARFDSAAVLRELAAVDLTRAVNLPPAQLGP